LERFQATSELKGALFGHLKPVNLIKKKQKQHLTVFFGATPIVEEQNSMNYRYNHVFFCTNGKNERNKRKDEE
jgi:hypothetical protein